MGLRLGGLGASGSSGTMYLSSSGFRRACWRSCSVTYRDGMGQFRRGTVLWPIRYCTLLDFKVLYRIGSRIEVQYYNAVPL